MTLRQRGAENKSKISFIIPTFNEIEHIAGVINSINRGRFSCPFFAIEIIVVDNGSTDDTVDTARNLGASVFVKMDANIGELRNLGATKSTGDVLIFIDGDVYLTDDWFSHFPATFLNLTENKKLVTGSRCGVSSPPSWIEKFWFAPILEKSVTYMNSGHLIVAKTFFDTLQGFDESLVTAEDFEFSIRAGKNGGRILNEPKLAVIHKGYPDNMRGFLKREVWHGTSDYHSLTAFFQSRIAMCSLFFLLCTC